MVAGAATAVTGVVPAHRLPGSGESYTRVAAGAVTSAAPLPQPGCRRKRAGGRAALRGAGRCDHGRAAGGRGTPLPPAPPEARGPAQAGLAGADPVTVPAGIPW